MCIDTTKKILFIDIYMSATKIYPSAQREPNTDVDERLVKKYRITIASITPLKVSKN